MAHSIFLFESLQVKQSTFATANTNKKHIFQKETNKKKQYTNIYECRDLNAYHPKYFRKFNFRVHASEQYVIQ